MRWKEHPSINKFFKKHNGSNFSFPDLAHSPPDLSCALLPPSGHLWEASHVKLSLPVQPYRVTTASPAVVLKGLVLKSLACLFFRCFWKIQSEGLLPRVWRSGRPSKTGCRQRPLPCVPWTFHINNGSLSSAWLAHSGRFPNESSSFFSPSSPTIPRPKGNAWPL